MGEIGIARREYLYDLDYCDIVLITRGYNHRHAHLWSATRWQTFWLMTTQNGSDWMQKNGFHNPTDLLKLPWEHEAPPPITQEEQDELQAEMDAINAGMKTGDDTGNDNGGGGSNDPHGDDIEG